MSERLRIRATVRVPVMVCAGADEDGRSTYEESGDYREEEVSGEVRWLDSEDRYDAKVDRADVDKLWGRIAETDLEDALIDAARPHFEEVW